MKQTIKKAEIKAIQLYEGEWSDGNFILKRGLKRSDLTTPGIQPSFVVYLDNNERILVGWTTKSSPRLFYIKEFNTNFTTTNSPAGVTSYTLKVIRMRGPQWQKITKIVKRGMTRWFQGDDFNLVGKFDKFTMPIIKQVYPQLIAADLVSVQPMTTPNVLFNLKKV